ncbi:DUF5803 family protein [Halomarina oriensis]|uniref:Uncharacterized protein n=1 Tax=Halomarina oriensis TaxID=671145 RepID=A0A6B0GR50_9EURY|nr:DUF5803 family protein [Halomarina oriensis]MWG35847.1 hypothetical protein [Halomarina oriensis]
MRRALALCLLALLTVSAGCTSLFGPGEVPDQQLNENATYDDLWEEEAGVYIDVGTDSYRAVYDLGENRTSLDVYGRTGFGLERPLDISGLRYRYQNGTVITPANSSNFTVDQGREELNITVPEPNGSLAFSAPKPGKSFTVPAFIEGVSYEAALPPATDAAVPLLSNVNPSPSATFEEDGRTHIRWDSVSRDVSVRYYLDRDLLIFGSIAGVLTIAGIAGAVYYLRQIRALERRREEVALDVNREE